MDYSSYLSHVHEFYFVVDFTSLFCLVVSIELHSNGSPRSFSMLKWCDWFHALLNRGIGCRFEESSGFSRHGN
ncbi:hypothetical protein LINPERPRIM_LOCUS22211 [Linum perenne]